MADEKALENDISAAVERELGANPIPTPAPALRPDRIRNLRPVNDPATEDQHARWLELGEKLHDQQAQLVKQLLTEYEAKHAELVAKNREVAKLNHQLAEETNRLRSIRTRLGYGR